MKFVKFPKTGVVARVYGDQLSFCTTTEVDSLHDFSKETLLDDLCLSLTGSYSLLEMQVVVLGQSKADAEVTIHASGVFNYENPDQENHPVEISLEEAIIFFSKQFKWSLVEENHALNSVSNDFGSETIIKLSNGREIHTPAFPEDCTYVRIVEFGFELAYWVDDEWADDPQVVMGAMLGLAHGK